MSSTKTRSIRSLYVVEETEALGVPVAEVVALARLAEVEPEPLRADDGRRAAVVRVVHARVVVRGVLHGQELVEGARRAPRPGAPASVSDCATATSPPQSAPTARQKAPWTALAMPGLHLDRRERHRDERNEKDQAQILGARLATLCRTGPHRPTVGPARVTRGTRNAPKPRQLSAQVWHAGQAGV